MIVRVAHDLELYLLVSFDALFYENLMNRRKLERIKAYFREFILVVGETASRAAERKRDSLKSQDFKSCASASSATPAWLPGWGSNPQPIG